MTEKKNILIIILISLLVIFIAYAGRELAKQTIERESLARKLSEIKKEVEIKEKTSFVQCQEIKAHPGDLVNIYLLGSFAFPKEGGKHFWNLFVINPEGDIIGSGYPLELSDMWQLSPINEDGDDTMDRMIGTGFNRKIGDYLIMVIPQQYVALSDTYSLQLNNLVLAKDVPFSANLLDHLYILRQTETGIIPIVPASVGCGF